MMYREVISTFTVLFLLSLIAPSAYSQEILNNNGFENGTAEWSTWTNYGTLSPESDEVRSGSGALKIVGSSHGAQAYQNVTLESGKTYEIRGWINIPDTGVNNAWLGIYSNICGGYLYDRVFTDGPTIGWIPFGPHTFTAPECVNSQYVQLGGYGNGGTVYWDDISLTESTDVPATTTDWYTEFLFYSNAAGTYYSSNPDGGILAWGEAYIQWGCINLYYAYQDTGWLDYLVLHIDQMIANMSDVPLFSPYDPQYVDGYAAWGQNRYSQYAPNYTEWLSSHGNIIGPIMRFVEIVYNDPALHADYLAKANHYLSEIESNIILLWYNNWDPDPGWIVGGDNHRYRSNLGYHVYEWSGWLNQPFNMHLCFTDPLVTLRRLSSSPLYTAADPALPSWYVSETNTMLQNFKNWMMHDTGNDLYTWLYGPHSAWPTLFEDVGHAWLDIQAAVQGFDIGVGFNATDLQRMANTFIHNVWNGSLTNPAFHYYISGIPHSTYDSPSGTTPQGHWCWGFLYLAGYDYRIQEAIAAYFDQHIDVLDNSPHIGTTAAMLAYTEKLYDVFPPGPVDNAAAVQGTGSDVDLSWNMPLLDQDGTELTGVAGYNIYRSTTGPNGVFEFLNPNPLTSLIYTDSGQWGQGNWYHVVAVDYAGNEGAVAALLGGAAASDFDENGNIGMEDLLFLISQWLSTTPQEHPSTGKTPDLVPDGQIDFRDYAFLLSQWAI